MVLFDNGDQVMVECTSSFQETRGWQDRMGFILVWGQQPHRNINEHLRVGQPFSDIAEKKKKVWEQVWSEKVWEAISSLVELGNDNAIHTRKTTNTLWII